MKKVSLKRVHTIQFHLCNVLEMTAIKRRRAVEGHQRPWEGHWGGHGYRRAAWTLDPFRILTVVWTQTHMSCNSAWGQMHTCVHIHVHTGTHGRQARLEGWVLNTRGAPFPVRKPSKGRRGSLTYHSCVGLSSDPRAKCGQSQQMLMF